MIKIEINGKEIDLKKRLRETASKAIDKSVQAIDKLQDCVEDLKLKAEELSFYTDSNEDTNVADFQDDLFQDEYPYGVDDDEDLIRIMYPTTDENGNKLSFEEFLDSIIGKGEISNPEEFFIELVTHVDHCETLDACSLSKHLVNVNYNTVIITLKLYYEHLSKIQIRSHLDEDFQNFVNTYPQIKEAYPKANMISLIRYYNKHFNR